MLSLAFLDVHLVRKATTEKIGAGLMDSVVLFVLKGQQSRRGEDMLSSGPIYGTFLVGKILENKTYDFS